MALFDKFAKNYDDGHKNTVSLSGFTTDYFYEYKVKEMHRVLSKQKIDPPTSILDFGCGVGSIDPYIRKYFPDSEIYGIDISTESIKVAKEKQSEFDISYAVFDEEKGSPFGMSFDLVFVSCVFHHIPREYHKKTLSFLRSCMNPNAFLFVFEHNPYNPAARIVFSKHDRPIDKDANMIYPGYLKRQMQRCNFEKVSLNFTVFFPKMLKAFMPLEKHLTCIPFGVQYYAMAKRDPTD